MPCTQQHGTDIIPVNTFHDMGICTHENSGCSSHSLGESQSFYCRASILGFQLGTYATGPGPVVSYGMQVMHVFALWT